MVNYHLFPSIILGDYQNISIHGIRLLTLFRLGRGKNYPASEYYEKTKNWRRPKARADFSDFSDEQPLIGKLWRSTLHV